MKKIIVREVWMSNLQSEFSLIQQCLYRYPYISMDTEFPGTIFNPTPLIPALSPFQVYSLMKQNVDALNLIQLGLTLSDAYGNLPQDNKFCYIWQFNFRDFDYESDPQNPDSISLLKRQGTDFSKNKREGVDSRDFSILFKASDFGRNSIRMQTWITFHGLYHFGFLIKIMMGRQLPNNLDGFMMMLELYFGPMICDLKVIGRVLGLHGGLEKVARSLNVERPVGKTHQAGSDSLMAMQVFVELMKKNVFSASIIVRLNNQLYGLGYIC